MANRELSLDVSHLYDKNKSEGWLSCLYYALMHHLANVFYIKKEAGESLKWEM